MSTAYAWAPITKVEDQPDGTVMVYGPATDTTLDRDQQRMDQAWLDKAMPQWMAEGGNVREQHDPLRAVGVAVGLHKDEGSGAWMLTSHVVDPVAVTKVKAGVLKGYSIGVKDHHITFGKAEAPNGLIDGGVIVETSLADRPSNPTAYFTIAKADDAGELVPVEDPEVVEVEEVEPDAVGDDTAAKAEAILAEVKALVPDLTKADTPSDVASAQQAIACIAALICSEATSLGAGRLSDAYDIKTLLQAVCALKYFIACESSETGTPGGVVSAGGDDGDMAMGGDAGVSAPAMADSSMDVAGSAYEMKTEDTPDLTKVDNAAIADMVKAAVAEATAPLKDELTLVKADLAKVSAMPQAGGPVAMRTASDAAAARASDATHLRAQADELLSKADATSDPTLKAGYRERAHKLMEQSVA